MGGDAVCVSRSLCLRVSGGWLKPEKQRKVLSNALHVAGSGSLKDLTSFRYLKQSNQIFFFAAAAGQKASTFWRCACLFTPISPSNIPSIDRP